MVTEPPLIWMVWPVTHAASSDASQTQAPATSAGSPVLPTGIALASEAVIVGSRDHAEIWAPDRWDGYRRALDDPEELARAFEGLGI